MPGKHGNPSLAEQLAELDNPVPKDIDPENVEDYQNSDSDDSSNDEDGADDGRSHYTKVGRSHLRDTALETPLKAAYKGQKSSRQDIFQDEFMDGFVPNNEFSSASAGNLSGGDDSAHSEDESELVDESASKEQLERNGRHASASLDSNSDQSEVSEGESDSDENESNSEDERQAADIKTMLADDQQTMVQEVVKTATAEAQKGRAVKKQLGVYDSLLDSRIKLQKGLQTTNILADDKIPVFSGQDVKETEYAAIELIEAISSLRHTLDVQEGNSTRSSGKRRYTELEHVSSDVVWRDIQEMDSSMASWRDKTLTKWSQKTQAVSAIDKSKKFKALNQSILAQIEESKSDRTKLLRRTQVKRYKQAAKTVVTTEDTSPDVFDDGDFYQEMLKDLIDSRMLDSANSNQMKWIATKQPKQKKANVDTRASKGRKLRFHVHEKLQNFMAPIPVGSWHEDQIDELFGSLFGQNLKMNEEDAIDDHEEDMDGARRIEVGDDFKLFG